MNNERVKLPKSFKLHKYSNESFFYIAKKGEELFSVMEVQKKINTFFIPQLRAEVAKVCPAITMIKGPYKLAENKQELEETEDTMPHIFTEGFFYL